MVLYNCPLLQNCTRECNKCSRKTTIEFHINIKFSYVKIKPNKKPITYSELKNKNEELEDKIQQIQNELLKNKEVIKCFSKHTNNTKMTRTGDSSGLDNSSSPDIIARMTRAEDAHIGASSSGLSNSLAARMTEYGKEYFQGDKNELLNEILQIVKNYNN
jgi:predicted house-cleaning noncanonical NTP pyrophosphatase (MazG superfamily)